MVDVGPDDPRPAGPGGWPARGLVDALLAGAAAAALVAAAAGDAAAAAARGGPVAWPAVAPALVGAVLLGAWCGARTRRTIAAAAAALLVAAAAARRVFGATPLLAPLPVLPAASPAVDAAILALAAGVALGAGGAVAGRWTAWLLVAGAAAAAIGVACWLPAALAAPGAAALVLALACTAGSGGAVASDRRTGWLAATAAALLLAAVLATPAPGAAAGLLSVAGAALAAAWILRRPWLGGVGLAFAASWWTIAPILPAADPSLSPLATAGDAAAVYARGSQELRLVVGGEVLAAAGPDRGEVPLAAVLLGASCRAGDRVQIRGPGGGRLAAALDEFGWLQVEVVEPTPRVAALRRWLAGDGPVPLAAAPAPGASPAARAPLAWLPAGSRQAIAIGDLPASAGEPTTSVEFQRALRTAVGDGLVLHLVALDHVQPARLLELCAAVAAAHPWNGVYAVGDGMVLASGAVPLRRAGRCDDWPAAARWQLHAAHLGGLDDLDHALLGTIDPERLRAPVTVAEEAGRAAAVALLGAVLAPAPAPARGSRWLRRWSATMAEQRAAAAALGALPDDAEGRAAAAALAIRFLPLGAPAAPLQAALGLPAADGIATLDAGLASRRAFAIDPTFFAAAPAVFHSLPGPRLPRGELEDLARLPEGARLAALASGPSPLAVALRARFPSAVAKALVAQAAAAPLGPPEAGALRELADPFVLDELARALAPHGRQRELLAFWRGDLPIPAALAALAEGAGEDQLCLAAALAGRRDDSCLPVLARLMVAADVQVRRLAAAALQHIGGAPSDYDPEVPPADSIPAARRVEALHNPRR